MRIHENNYPILAYLKNPDKGIGLKIPAEQQLEAWKYFDDFFQDPHDTCPIFSEHVDIVSQPFIHAAWANREKIMTTETLREVLREPLYGTLICGQYIILYYFMWQDGNVAHKALTCANEHLVSINTGLGSFLVKRDYKKVIGIDIPPEHFDHWVLWFHLFKKYADVETVKALSNKKVKAPDGEKVLNETMFPMTYTDCSWFRNIVRKEGFMVKGHFRLQPCKKDGEWTHKLIYIEPFQKHGYTRTAKKTVNERKIINEE